MAQATSEDAGLGAGLLLLPAEMGASLEIERCDASANRPAKK
jgi:hypothetical protein